MFVVRVAKEKEANLDPGDVSPLTRKARRAHRDALSLPRPWH